MYFIISDYYDDFIATLTVQLMWWVFVMIDIHVFLYFRLLWQFYRHSDCSAGVMGVRYDRYTCISLFQITMTILSPLWLYSWYDGCSPRWIYMYFIISDYYDDFIATLTVQLMWWVFTEIDIHVFHYFRLLWRFYRHSDCTAGVTGVRYDRYTCISLFQITMTILSPLWLYSWCDGCSLW